VIGDMGSCAIGSFGGCVRRGILGRKRNDYMRVSGLNREG